MINTFLTAYIQNDTAALRETLAENVTIEYSTIGSHTGRDTVLQALALPQPYDVRTVTATNRMTYEENGTVVTALMAHHLLAYEKGSELYPLCFGGKYVFTTDAASGKIIHVAYAQEYQVENTLFIRDWKLAGHDADLSAVAGFDLNKALAAALAEQGHAAQAAALCKVFFWAVDARKLDFLNSLVTEDVHCLRFKTMSYGKIETTGAAQMAAFIDECKAYYAMDQYSIVIREVAKTPAGLTATASHLIPHRTGTKKLNVNTKYHSFFDEDITIQLVPVVGGWKISDVSMKKIVDVHYNGFTLLEL